MKLGLRARFTVWFGVAALLTIAVTTIITWIVVSARYRAGFEKSFHTAEVALNREVHELEASVLAALDGVSSPKLRMIGGLLVDLRKNGGLVSTSQLSELEEGSRANMEMLEADTLTIVLTDDTVVASPHFDRRGERDPRPRELARARQPRAVVGWDKVMRQPKGGRERKAESIMVVRAAKTIREGGYEATVELGKQIGMEFLARLERNGEVEARLTDARGNQLAATESDWSPLADEPQTEYVLRDAGGKAIGFVTVAVPDDALRDTLRQVAIYTALLGVLAVVAAIALGFLVARRMTRDLDAVVAGAHAVSRGDLDHVVDVRAQDEIGQLAGAFNAMTTELRDSKERLLHAERVAAWQDIAKRLAHEIKNPLTPIQMSVETMRKAHEKRHPSFEETFHEATRTILEEVQRLKKIVGEFSQFARLPKPERRACDLNEVVESALALYRGAVRVISELEPSLPPLEADKDQLTQVVLNLLENARDAVAARGSDQSVGRITVRTRAKTSTVELEVEDNGPGFEAMVREKLFTPYFTTKESGTGLGLSIAQRIVAEHGGRISAASDPGKGARFVVELPAIKVTASARAST